MKNRLFYLLGTGLVALSMTSCDLDINKDPYDVTDLDLNQLLTCTEYEVGITFSEGYYLNSNFGAYVQHTTSREIDNYSLVANYSTLGNTWEQAYKYAIKNCDEMIKQGDEQNSPTYAGIGRVLRAYTYLNMVDLWGDIPYSQANVEGIESPEADPSVEIYNDLLKVINQAIENFKVNGTESITIGSNDLFYAGNKAKWLKAANTLKLKLLTQSRLAKDQITGWSSELSALIAENNFMTDGDDLQFPHSKAETPSDERNSGFVDEYAGGQKSVWINPWFYEIMNGKTYNVKNNPLAGIVDPRCPYYYYCQATEGQKAANRTDYRDGAFISIFMGSNSGLASGTQEDVMTCVGIYPVGGQFDEGNGGKIDQKKGSAAAPDKMLLAYSVPFMKAELILAGAITGDAKQCLEDGIKASIAHVNSVTKTCDATVPSIGTAAVNEFVSSVIAKYDAASADRKLEIVMTEKWIANFYNSVEAYSDIRRTGYPVLFNGQNNGDRAIYTPYEQTEEATPAAVPVQYESVRILDYPRIMWYPDGETQVNKNISNVDRVVSKKTVFWDK